MRISAKFRVWFIIGLTALLILAVPLSMGDRTPVDRTFRIEASRFQYSPATLQVNHGDRVTLEVVSTDVVHGLSIDGYNLNLTVDPGQTRRVTFVADLPGTFRFRCSETCGNMHPFMIGKLYVGQNTLLWRVTALSGLAILAGLWKLRSEIA